MNYIVYDKSGKMLRKAICPPSHCLSQAKEDEFIMEGTADDATQKVEFDGFDAEGQPINPRVVNKTPKEIEKDNPTPPEIPKGKRPAHIINAQWQDVLSRIKALEGGQ